MYLECGGVFRQVDKGVEIMGAFEISLELVKKYVPDIYMFTVHVGCTRKNSEVAFSDLQEHISELKNKVSELGGELTVPNLSNRINYAKDKKSISDYTCSGVCNIILCDVADVQNIRPLVEYLDSVSWVLGVNCEVDTSKREEYKVDVLKELAMLARERANLIASSLGFSVVGIESGRYRGTSSVETNCLRASDTSIGSRSDFVDSRLSAIEKQMAVIREGITVAFEMG